MESGPWIPAFAGMTEVCAGMTEDWGWHRIFMLISAHFRSFPLICADGAWDATSVINSAVFVCWHIECSPSSPNRVRGKL